MNRRQFTAGLLSATATVPVIGIGGTSLRRDKIVALRQIAQANLDPGAVIAELHKRLNASYKLTHEAMLANMRDQFWAHEPERPLKETLHGIS